jgi:hypothetical protein
MLKAGSLRPHRRNSCRAAQAASGSRTLVRKGSCVLSSAEVRYRLRAMRTVISSTEEFAVPDAPRRGLRLTHLSVEYSRKLHEPSPRADINRRCFPK